MLNFLLLKHLKLFATSWAIMKLASFRVNIPLQFISLTAKQERGQKKAARSVAA
jgi:hypothetical protein